MTLTLSQVARADSGLKTCRWCRVSCRVRRSDQYSYLFCACSWVKEAGPSYRDWRHYNLAMRERWPSLEVTVIHEVVTTRP